jgi:hypothetical protein
MKKSTVFAAEAGQDEEGVALVPPPAPQESGRPWEKGDAAAPVAQARRWSSLMQTKGVGSVMIGMVILALMIGAHWWFDPDAVSNNYA